jgi:hypothetical protein
LGVLPGPKPSLQIRVAQSPNANVNNKQTGTNVGMCWSDEQ